VPAPYHADITWGIPDRPTRAFKLPVDVPISLRNNDLRECSAR